MASRRRAQGSARTLRKAPQGAPPVAMLWHLVLFTPRPDLSDADAGALVESFAAGVRRIPTVRDVRIGRRVTHGAGYEQASAGADILVMLAFDDVEGLKAYLGHPAHESIGAQFADASTSANVYDFDVRSEERRVGKVWKF